MTFFFSPYVHFRIAVGSDNAVQTIMEMVAVDKLSNPTLEEELPEDRALKEVS